MKKPHVSVLLNEILQHFSQKQLHTFLDATVGAAGHSKAILEAHAEIDSYIGCDRDPSALKIAQDMLEPWKDKVKLVQKNFCEIDQFLEGEKVDGILMDLGVSSMQLDQAERGFSFSKEAPLDMRMDPTQHLSAYDVVNKLSEKELGGILRDLGEEPFWKKVAAAIVQERQNHEITTTKQLASIVSRNARKKKGLHPATLSFQGIRIYVNQELDSIEKGIKKAVDALSPGGILQVISFHSLEDRIVKNTFKLLSGQKLFIDQVHHQQKPQVQIVTRKPVTPSDEEVSENPRARSAKLRVVEKLKEAV